VGIIGCFMLYGVVRFWIMWGSAFHGLNLLRKNDSRNPKYWQQQKRPLGSLEFGSIWHAVKGARGCPAAAVRVCG
jgi:hypothetical protein